MGVGMPLQCSTGWGERAHCSAGVGGSAQEVAWRPAIHIR